MFGHYTKFVYVMSGLVALPIVFFILMQVANHLDKKEEEFDRDKIEDFSRGASIEFHYFKPLLAFKGGVSILLGTLPALAIYRILEINHGQVAELDPKFMLMLAVPAIFFYAGLNNLFLLLSSRPVLVLTNKYLKHNDLLLLWPEIEKAQCQVIASRGWTSRYLFLVLKEREVRSYFFLKSRIFRISVNGLAHRRLLWALIKQKGFANVLPFSS